MKNILFITLFLNQVSIYANQTQQFDGKNVKQAFIKNGFGDIGISTTRNNQISVTFQKIKFEKNCVLNIGNGPRGFGIEVRDSGWAGNSKCQVNFNIKLPKHIAIDIKLGLGNLKFSRIQSNVSYELGSGDINAKNISVDKFMGKTGKGNTIINGKVSDAALSTGLGNINANISAVPKKGRLSVDVGKGDISVFLPASSRIKSQLVTGIGSIKNDFNSDVNSQFKISLKSGFGNLRLKKD